jgi:hypothetical protein
MTEITHRIEPKAAFKAKTCPDFPGQAFQDIGTPLSEGVGFQVLAHGAGKALIHQLGTDVHQDEQDTEHEGCKNKSNSCTDNETDNAGQEAARPPTTSQSGQFKSSNDKDEEDGAQGFKRLYDSRAKGATLHVWRQAVLHIHAHERSPPFED